MNPSAQVRQAEQPGTSSRIRCLNPGEQPIARPEGNRSARRGIGTASCLGYGVQQHHVLALLRLAQVPERGQAAAASGERAEHGLRQSMFGNQGDPSCSGRVRHCLDPRLERAQRYAVVFEPLAVEGDRVGQDGAAQRFEAIQREAPQIGNYRIEFLLLRGHHISPDEIHRCQGESCRRRGHDVANMP